MRRNQQRGWGLCAALALLLLPAATAWGYYFDDRREMSLSGFAYSRAVIATQDGLGNQKHTFYAGNLVSHRNFLTLEWRHNLNRISREFPTLGPLAQFANLSALDYYINVRDDWDGALSYGPLKIRRMMRGTRLNVPYFDDPKTATPFDGLYFTPFPKAPWPPGHAADYPGDVQSLTNRRWQRKLRKNHLQMFEYYFNIVKGPLFLRIGRQNLSWGETDGFRLLDQINPLENSFGGFLTSLDERRVPLSMIRAQWSFGSVGPISDLTLEGFVAPDRRMPLPGLPTTSVHFWHGEQTNANTAIMYGRTPCGGDFMAQRGLPPVSYVDAATGKVWNYGGSGPGPRHGGNCSTRGEGPHSNFKDARGGGRLLGTIGDFTFSIAHYYTYQDIPVVRAVVISPTPAHLAWDLGLPTDPRTGKAWADNVVATPFGKGNTANPWGVDDPFAARAISSEANALGRGNFGVGGAERNVRSTLNFQQIQVTGGSLSFPVNALTGMFVGSDNPLYYIYTTFRSEIAFFHKYPTMTAYAVGDGTTAFSRFLGVDLPGTVPAPAGTAPPVAFCKPTATVTCSGTFGPFANQIGHRTAKIVKRDHLLWNIGLDHNQWIRFLNQSNSFTISAQQFWWHRNGQHTDFDPSRPPSILNDKDIIAARQRRFTVPLNTAKDPKTGILLSDLCDPRDSGTGSRRGCSAWDFPSQEWLTTFSVNTQYLAGNLRPSFTFFYDWSGSYLVQPGVDWTFWDPFRVSLRYNYIEGRGRRGLGGSNRKDNVWFELQYLLY